jgi:putative membrane protein
MTASGGPERFDATRRTHLANERTYLAWWRTGLTAFAVSVAFGKIVPVLADVDRWPYVVAGVAFALVGTGFIAYGAHRQRSVDRALERGEFAGTDSWALVALTACGVALGLLTLVLVVVSG